MDDFICPKWKAAYEACRQPLDHRYKDMLQIRHLGSEDCRPDWTNWSITASFDLLIFHYDAHHCQCFSRFGYAEEDMVVTGCGFSIRSGRGHHLFDDDPKGLWELKQEALRVLKSDPSLLCYNGNK